MPIASFPYWNLLPYQQIPFINTASYDTYWELFETQYMWHRYSSILLLTTYAQTKAHNTETHVPSKQRWSIIIWLSKSKEYHSTE